MRPIQKKYLFDRLIYLAIILIFGHCNSDAQKEDYNWLVGYYGSRDTAQNKFGLSLLNFENDVPSFKKIKDLNFSFDVTDANLSSKDGKFQLFSNGMHIYNSDLKPILKGDTINYGEYWELWNFTSPTFNKTFGMRMSQSMIFLPRNANEIMYFSNIITISPRYSHFLIGKIKKKDDDFELVYKDSLILQDVCDIGAIQACRHGNGRDWWITFPDSSHTFMYAYLYDVVRDQLQLKSKSTINIPYPHGFGQGVFSPDGRYYALSQLKNTSLTHCPFSIFYFDRNSGLFTLIGTSYSDFIDIWAGAAFSPNSRYLYQSTSTSLFQYDMEAEDIFKSKIKIADIEENRPDSLTWPPMRFGYLNLAPNGKIYISSGNDSYFHIIHYPDEAGQECALEQHAMKILLNANSVPNFPHFRLGPDDGSLSDTLGLNNNVVAKFRYEQDTLNHLRVRFTDLSYYAPADWHWDFGDNSTFDGQIPYYHTFPTNGNYNVCLEVSNQNSVDKICRNIKIGTSSLKNELLSEEKELVTLFPNPVQNEAILTLDEYIPEHAIVYFYDTSGREVFHQRIFYGWNTINLKELNNGNYFYQVFDGSKTIASGKLIKI